MIKFVKTSENLKFEPVDKIEFEMSNESTLPELLDAFQRFLKASGYHFSGEVTIDVIDEEV